MMRPSESFVDFMTKAALPSSPPADACAAESASKAAAHASAVRRRDSLKKFMMVVGLFPLSLIICNSV